MILVTGATGNVGSRLVRELAAGGVRQLVKQSSIAADEDGDATIVTAHRRIEEVMRRYRFGGVTRTVSPWVEQLTGRAPRTFVDFVRERRETVTAA